MSVPNPTGQRFPAWFYLGRAILAAVVGAAVIWHEASGSGAGRVIIIIAGLLLFGFVPADLATFWKGRTNGGGGVAD